MADGESAKRQVAKKVQVKEVLEGRYVKEEGWLPNYVDTGSKKFSRVNILGVMVDKDSEAEPGSSSFVLDDGSGKISLRFFEFPENINVGEMVNVIGRPREFGSERYIVPEIVKKITNPKWVELRKLELTREKQKEIAEKRASRGTGADRPGESISGEQGPGESGQDRKIAGTEGQRKEEKGGLVVEDEDLSEGPEKEEESQSPTGKVFDAIKKLDEGTGVGFDQVIVKTKIEEIDIHVKRLLEQGDIFEIRPGRYKVLE